MLSPIFWIERNFLPNCMNTLINLTCYFELQVHSIFTLYIKTLLSNMFWKWNFQKDIERTFALLNYSTTSSISTIRSIYLTYILNWKRKILPVCKNFNGSYHRVRIWKLFNNSRFFHSLFTVGSRPP